jgi:hypothetical protein
VGQSFYDCNALGTHTDPSAMAACTAYALTQGGSAANCSDGWTCPVNSATAVCYGNTSGTTCTKFCWYYLGSSIGTVTSCSACDISAGTWN